MVQLWNFTAGEDSANVSWLTDQPMMAGYAT